MADKDAQTELKKRARRRLVGAIALALAAAIVLPMVMDHEPRSTPQDIQIRIPSPDSGGFNSRVMPAKPAVQAPPGGEVRPAPAEPVPPVAAAKPVPPPHAAAEPGKPAPKPPEPEKAAAASATAPKVEPKPPPAAASVVEEAARARAILNDDKGQFIVQLGVFADPANVTKVRARVKAEGYNSFVEQMEGGDKGRTRVRAGPFASRAEAEKARDKLKRAGLAGIVAPKS